MQSLDAIFAGREAAPSEAQVEDKHPVAQAEPPAAEQATTQPDGSAEAGQEQAEKPQGEGVKTVPHEALHAEKQKVKRYTEEVADLRRTLEENNKAWERRMEALMQRVAPPAPPAEPPHFFDDPEKAVMHTVSPLAQRVEQIAIQQMRFIASQKHGPEAVDEAQRAFLEALQTGEAGQADLMRLQEADNRFDVIVQWKKQRDILKDPDGYRSQIEAEVRAKLEAELRGEQGQSARSGAQPTLMPTPLVAARNVGSRAGPAWSGPRPLQDIFDRKRM